MPSTLGASPFCKTAVFRDKELWKTHYCEVTASQTFVAGDWVYKAAAGTLSIAAASGNNVNSSDLQLMGIALASAADVLAEPAGRRICPVAVPLPGAQFLAPVYSATPASAVLAATDIDSEVSTHVLPLRNQGGIWCVDIDGNGTDDAVAIMERHPMYPFSERYGLFWCSIIPAALLSSAT